MGRREAKVEPGSSGSSGVHRSSHRAVAEAHRVEELCWKENDMISGLGDDNLCFMCFVMIR